MRTRGAHRMNTTCGRATRTLRAAAFLFLRRAQAPSKLSRVRTAGGGRHWLVAYEKRLKTANLMINS